ncbi:hypothetical protein F9K50_05370 [bacterium]|nr:MAG: hypothetical protein F9K50_05370 [bacterium]
MKVLAMLSWLLLQIPAARAWNPDVAYGLPQERRMCVRRDSDETLLFSAIAEDEDCPAGSRRYIVYFAKEPRGAMALIPTTTSLRFYPPLTLQWPATDHQFSGSPLWHFTCVQKTEISPLGNRMALNSYRGEMTFSGKENCLDAEQRALRFCQEEWKGQALLESCPLSWGSP